LRRGTAGIHVATGHVPHRVITGILIRDRAQRIGSVDRERAVRLGPTGPARQPIEGIIAERLLIRRDSRPGGGKSTMVSASWRAHIPGPHQSIERIVTEGLILRLRSTRNRGKRRAQA
jgi:hypothetical protein